MHQIVQRLGFAPDTTGGAHSAPSDSPAGKRRGGNGKGRRGEGRGEEGGEEGRLPPLKLKSGYALAAGARKFCDSRPISPHISETVATVTIL